MQALIPMLLTSGGPEGDWGDGWWIGRLLFLLFWVGVIAVAIWFFSRRGRHGSHGGDSDSAANVLGERFARGEIGNDEYVNRLRQLREAQRTNPPDGKRPRD